MSGAGPGVWSGRRGLQIRALGLGPIDAPENLQDGTHGSPCSETVHDETRPSGCRELEFDPGLRPRPGTSSGGKFLLPPLWGCHRQAMGTLRSQGEDWRKVHTSLPVSLSLHQSRAPLTTQTEAVGTAWWGEMMPPSWGWGEQEAPRGCGPTLAYGLPGCGVLLSRRCPGLLTVKGGQHSAGIALLGLPLATSHRGLPISQQALCPLFCSSVWGKVNPER